MVSGPGSGLTTVDVPLVGRVVLFQATTSASTITPRLGKSTGWAASTQNDIGGQLAPLAHVNEAVPLPFCFGVSGDRTLFGRSVVAAGTATVTTLIVIEEGAS